MIKLTLSTEGFTAMIKAVQRVVNDPTPTLNRVVYPWLLDHMEGQFETAGAWGGSPWSFAGEPIYERYKRQLLGDELAGKPLAVDPAHERLKPSLLDPSHPDHIVRLEGGRLEIGTSVEYARRLLFEGGIGPFGEAYPARNPFEMTSAQREELDDEMRYDFRLRLKR